MNADVVIRTRRRRVVIGPLRPRAARAAAAKLQSTADAPELEATVRSQDLVPRHRTAQALLGLARRQRRER
jgi:hypothetical protein